MKSRFAVLVMRELQEHRVLWLAPPVVGVFLLLMVLFGNVVGPGRPVNFSLSASGGDITRIGAMTMIGVTVMLGVAGAVTLVAYLLDCLFAERRDRTILFWKSLPVSDAETVAAKLFVTLVVVPVLVQLFSLLLNPLLVAAAYLRYASVREVLTLQLLAGWPEALLRLSVLWIHGILWYLPLVAYLMLCSVLASRAPFVYAALPPVVLLMGEQLMSEGDAIRKFIGQRLVNGRALDRMLGTERPLSYAFEPFHDPALWVGVAVGAGMLYTIIRLRRYRDET